MTVALAESLTGGEVASAIVDRPGVSTWFAGSLVTYSSSLKAALLSVKNEELDTFGAASEWVARRMAKGVIARTGVEVGVAVTGVAGPGPDLFGTPEGTVHVAVATPAGLRHRALLATGGRAAIRDASVVATLELLLEALETLPPRRSAA